MKLGTEQHRIEEKNTKKFLRRLFGLGGFGIHVKKHFFLSGLDKYIRHQPNKILDFGCGNGSYSFLLNRKWPDTRIIMVDGDENHVKNCEKIIADAQLKNIVIHQSNYESLTLSEEFDLIIALDSIYYSTNAPNILLSLVDRVQSGGYLFLSSPELTKYYDKSFSYYQGYVDINQISKLWNEQEVLRILKTGQMEIKQIYHYPNHLVKNIINFQQNYNKLAFALYPVFGLIFYISKYIQSKKNTHFLIVAKKIDYSASL